MERPLIRILPWVGKEDDSQENLEKGTEQEELEGADNLDNWEPEE